VCGRHSTPPKRATLSADACFVVTTPAHPTHSSRNAKEDGGVVHLVSHWVNKFPVAGAQRSAESYPEHLELS